MEIFVKNAYYEEKFELMSEWIRLFQRLNSERNIRVFTEDLSAPIYEGKVCDVTYMDIENLADCGSEGIVNIDAKEDVLIITVADNG